MVSIGFTSMFRTLSREFNLNFTFLLIPDYNIILKNYRQGQITLITLPQTFNTGS